MNNKECAEMFANTIQKLASNPDNLDNFEGYLSRHFDTWIKKFANTPEGLVGEMKQFADMEM